MNDRELGDYDQWKCTEPAPERPDPSDAHDGCERVIAERDKEIARLTLALKLRHEHEQLTQGARVELATSLHAYECPGCEQARPRCECCFEVSPYRGGAFYVCHRPTCIGDVLCERLPPFTPTPVVDEDVLPW